MIDFNTVDFNTIKTLYLANNEVEELYINGSKVWGKSSEVGPFTIEARVANVTIGSSRYGSPSARDLEYSVDGGTTWNTFTLGSTTVTLANAGDKMMLRGTNSTIANTWQNYWKLTFSNDVDVYGNLNSLLGGSEETLGGSFYGLFDGQTHLIDASGLVLPWTTIASIATSDCAAFEAMFRNCSGLVSAPDLPATTVDSWCYNHMFSGCSSLEDAPTIYAVDLAEASLYFAFDGCSSLTGEVSFPNLHTANAYQAMERCFRYAGMEVVSMPNLTSAQATNAMTGIFEACPNLTTINVPKLTYTNGNYNMNAFAIGSDNLEVVDFSEATAVPAIQ